MYGVRNYKIGYVNNAVIVMNFPVKNENKIVWFVFMSLIIYGE